MTNTERILSQVEARIREGKSSEALFLLKRLLRTSVPPRYVLPVAALAQRLNQVSTVARLLYPIVRPQDDHRLGGTPEAQAEYAMALIRSGVRREGHRILQTISPETLPRVLLIRAQGLMAEWNYAKGIPLLVAYSKLVSPSDYTYLVAQANLAACLIAEKENASATEVLTPLLVETSARGARLLHHHVYQLAAQNAIDQENWGLAEVLLNSAQFTAGVMGPLENLFLRKWQAMLALSKSGPRSEAVFQMRSVRTVAVRLNHWETVRDCDRLLAILANDNESLNRVYFGSPFPAYRKNILGLLNGAHQLKSSFQWMPGFAKVVPKDVVDVQNGTFSSSDATLEKGSLLHRLLLAAASDFYRPIPLTEFHALVYTDDIFQPRSSELKVRRLLQRFREFTAKHGVSLDIVARDAGYQLSSTDCALKVVAEIPLASKDEERLEVIKQKAAGETFQRKDVEQWLRVSLSSANRWIGWAMEQGIVQRIDSGSRTLYSLGTLRKVAK